MKSYSDFNAMRADLLNYLGVEAPEAIKDDLRKVAVSPDLTGIINFLNDVYNAHKNGETIDPELLQVVAAGFVIAIMSGFHGMAADDVAARKRAALLRDAGEPEIPGILTWGDPADDPAPLKAAEPAPGVTAPTPTPTV